MQKHLIAAVLVVSFTALVLAAETFTSFLTALKGCTIMTAEPTDKTRYKVLGKHKSKVEAEKAIGSMKECYRSIVGKRTRGRVITLIAW